MFSPRTSFFWVVRVWALDGCDRLLVVVKVDMTSLMRVAKEQVVLGHGTMLECDNGLK